jgi:hypothetical protein
MGSFRRSIYFACVAVVFVVVKVWVIYGICEFEDFPSWDDAGFCGCGHYKEEVGCEVKDNGDDGENGLNRKELWSHDDEVRDS